MIHQSLQFPLKLVTDLLSVIIWAKYVISNQASIEIDLEFLPLGKRSLSWAPHFSQFLGFLSGSIEDPSDPNFKCISCFSATFGTIRQPNLNLKLLVFTIYSVATYCELNLLTIFKSLSVGTCTLIYATASCRYYYSYLAPEGLRWQHHLLPKRSLLWVPRFSQYPSFLSCSIGDQRDHYFKCISLFLCYPQYKLSTTFELKTTATSTCISSKAIRTCNLLVYYFLSHYLLWSRSIDHFEITYSRYLNICYSQLLQLLCPWGTSLTMPLSPQNVNSCTAMGCAASVSLQKWLSSWKPRTLF